jgi:hypothetical protein
MKVFIIDIRICNDCHCCMRPRKGRRSKNMN